MPFNQILDPNNYTPQNVNKTVNKAISNVQSGATLKSLAQPNMSVNPQTQTVAPTMSVAPKATNPANMTVNPQTMTPVPSQSVQVSQTSAPTLSAKQKAELDSAYYRTGGQTGTDKKTLTMQLKI